MPAPRKSVAEHRLTSTPVWYDPSSPDSGEVLAGNPKCPSGLSKGARSAFKKLAKLLKDRGQLTAGDAELLRIYSLLFDRHERAIEAITKEGEITSYTRLSNRGEPIQVVKENLWLSVAQESESEMVRILDRLGLTPASRAKIKRVKPRPQSEPFPVGSVGWLLEQRKKEREEMERCENVQNNDA
jgi:P27 family predicted phage terminase small subunit